MYRKTAQCKHCNKAIEEERVWQSEIYQVCWEDDNIYDCEVGMWHEPFEIENA